MLCVNPLLLRYDIGFQLSFVATFAILISSGWRKQLAFQNRWASMLVEGMMITCAVLLFVTPLSIFHFGTVSPYAFLANVVALPIVPVAFFLSCMVVFIGWVPGVGALFGWLAYGILHSLIYIVSLIARFPGSTTMYNDMHLWVLGCWYVAWTLFFWHWNKKE